MSNHIYIGKIPAYNSRINDPTIQYEKRLLNNLTVTKFEPIAYRINLDLSTAKAAIEGVVNPHLNKNGEIKEDVNAGVSNQTKDTPKYGLYTLGKLYQINLQLKVLKFLFQML